METSPTCHGACVCAGGGEPLFDRTDEDQASWFKEQVVLPLTVELWKAIDTFMHDDPVITPPLVQNMGSKLVRSTNHALDTRDALDTNTDTLDTHTLLLYKLTYVA